MREFQEKKKFRKYLYSKVTVVILLLLILFFARATWGVYMKVRETSANALRAERELAKLHSREELLTTEIERLNTTEGIEEEIRAKFGVSKPGEQMVIIVDDKIVPSSEALPEESWWSKFKGLFR